MEQRLERVEQLIRSKRELIDSLAEVLLEKEVIEADEFERLIEEDAGSKKDAA